MTLNEFCKYVLDNISRATLSNAFRISDRFNSDYNFIEFVDGFKKCVVEAYGSRDSLDFNTYIKLLNVCIFTTERYNSEFNYNKYMLIDEFIVNIWEIMNGYKNAQK